METSFGTWVRRRRKALDLTQNALARQVGCSPSLIFKIETDERRPSRQMAELLAAQLEIPADQRETFLRVARQELAVMRMAAPDALALAASPAAPPDPAAQSQHPLNGPGLRAASLPVFPTLLIGREHEIDIVVQQILDPACRLLTLTGPGGVGKTRLAVEVARRLESAHPDGVFFLPMAGVEQPESIVPAIANALGLVFSGPADPLLQVVQALRQKNALLIFDNMEHLVAGSAMLGEILQQVPGLRILLTSREPIHLQWEWVFEVQGLPIPESAQPGALESNSAPALFLQRMRQAAPQLTRSAEGLAVAEPAHQHAEAIIQICKLVDGLPLAIELAASWSRVMSPDEIAEELAHGLDLLETTLQDVPARHRSIRLVFDHSWKLLTADERAALMKLSVFPGGFTRSAAQEAVGASVMLLSALVSKSLLRYGKQAGRYDFHELVRQYALQRLSEQPDQDHDAYAQMAGYYASWLAQLEMPLKSARQIEISARMRAESANWRAAWYWAARQRRIDLLRQMEPSLSWFNEIHGDNAEALPAITYAVSQLRAAGAPAALPTSAERSSFALLIDQLGWFEYRTGNVERATALFQESQALAQAQPQPDHEALYYVHCNWAYMALVTGDLERSARMAQASLENARAMPDGQWHAAIAINILGIIEYQRGNLDEAYHQLTGSLAIWRKVGDLRGLVFCMLYLSAAGLALEAYDTVEAILGESNAIARQKHDRWALAFGLDLLGQSDLARGQAQAAADNFRQSLALSQEIGDQWAAALAMIHAGEAALALGDDAGAQNLLRAAYENARQAHWVSIILDALVVALDADEQRPAETRLAIALAVLANEMVTLATRLRAQRLCDQLAAALDPRQVTVAQAAARQKSAEEWAGAYFLEDGPSSRPIALTGREWTAGASAG